MASSNFDGDKKKEEISKELQESEINTLTEICKWFTRRPFEIEYRSNNLAFIPGNRTDKALRPEEIKARKTLHNIVGDDWFEFTKNFHNLGLKRLEKKSEDSEDEEDFFIIKDPTVFINKLREITSKIDKLYEAKIYNPDKQIDIIYAKDKDVASALALDDIKKQCDSLLSKLCTIYNVTLEVEDPMKTAGSSNSDSTLRSRSPSR